MTILFRNIMAASVAAVLANSAMAADGTINFSGEIIAASCAIAGGAGSTVTGEKGKQQIDVKLGKVSSDSLGSGGGAGIVAGTNINLNLDCGATGTGLTTVKLKFDPSAGSGIDLKNANLLKTTGTAEGVGVGLYDSSSKLLNLSANETFDAPLVNLGTPLEPKYSANLNLRAAFVANGVKVKAGQASATLPFTLTYE